jgi:hypothetical protein
MEPLRWSELRVFSPHILQELLTLWVVMLDNAWSGSPSVCGHG